MRILNGFYEPEKAADLIRKIFKEPDKIPVGSYPGSTGLTLRNGKKLLKMKDSMPILLVDDDHTDVMLFKRALDDLKITNPLIHLTDCQKALEYLINEENEQPWIVVTDLNIPQMGGLEFLSSVKARNTLKQAIVIVLSGSGDERDVDESFRLGAAGYMIKPLDYKKLVEMIRIIHAYWTLSELPYG